MNTSAHLPHHPPRHPRFPQPISWENLREIFRDCQDFSSRTVVPQGWSNEVRIAWLEGMVKTERLNDYIIRPLINWRGPEDQLPTLRLLAEGVWSQAAVVQTEMDALVASLLTGSCAVFLPNGTVTCPAATEEKRSIGQPDNENEMKGAKDSFVESLRTNTSLIRRRLADPQLRLRRYIIGRRTRTPVELLWLEGLTDPNLPRQIGSRLEKIDIDGLLTTADLEEYLTDPIATLFPRILFTERPDRICQGLLDGRAALLAEGIAAGCLLPGDLPQFMQTPQDQSYHWLAASCLKLLRWCCLCISLVLPGFYIAAAHFHHELIPTQLAMSIIANEQQVPFPTALEVLGLLTAFEILQEAGLRLPKTIGQTVSIIGGLVVGQAAVEARLVSPVVVIVVASAGIAGFTIPNQDLANALRLWRLGCAAAAWCAGLFGLMLVLAALIIHLAGIEQYGYWYMTPFDAARPSSGLESSPLLRRPLPHVKQRPESLHPIDRRKRW